MTVFISVAAASTNLVVSFILLIVELHQSPGNQKGVPLRRSTLWNTLVCPERPRTYF